MPINFGEVGSDNINLASVFSNLESVAAAFSDSSECAFFFNMTVAIYIRLATFPPNFASLGR